MFADRVSLCWTLTCRTLLCSLGLWIATGHLAENRLFDDGVAKVHIGGAFALVENAPGWWEGGVWILIDRQGKKLAQLRKTKGE